MTNEEAIKWIERFELAFPLPIEDYIDAKEALDMAIKALENKGYDQGYHEGFSDAVRVHRVLYGDRMKIGMNEMIPSNSMPDSNLGDCISRKDTIEWLKKVTVTEGIEFKTGFEQILYDIEQMPPVTPSYNSVKTELKPCEDAISREAVMKCFKKWQPYMATRLWDYEQELSKLPSVTPKADLWSRLYIWLNDMHLGISPDEFTPDDERKIREAQTDIIEDIMGWIEANVFEQKPKEDEE